MRKNQSLQLLKLIGVGLFIWIFSQIDQTMLLNQLLSVDVVFLAISFLALLCVYLVKAVRWHVLVRSAGLIPTYQTSWKIYMIGVFLSTITPAKIGDFGKVAYLTRDGMEPKIGALLIIIDRIADIVILGIVGVMSIGILFGVKPMIITMLVGILFIATIWMCSQFSKKLKKQNN